ncbi:DNA polymerase I [Candidatus Magnetominusculus xianensis]|uniref:DNA polymerase I n=2 Tax=Candidatus Magnetominusculus xianensis TaxID=1748249 RepID=A0ABR5SHV2_9BACT|nr:DNA polymerase I [Candidatus Magnetominusculus xianensis]MBF0403862.1 hypothetical protein [Nitrospirota bacterium]
MIIQIQDELLFEVPESELDEVKALVRQEMENVLTLDITLSTARQIKQTCVSFHLLQVSVL